MNHLIIIPAYNEAANIRRVVMSLVEQTLPIQTIIVVDDGSTDTTADIVQVIAHRYPQVRLVSNNNKGSHDIGAKIVRAFNLGLETVDLTSYDTISKFDADLAFPANYFESVEAYLSDKKLGLVGGQCIIEKENDWMLETVSNADHIRGALKTYRVEAFQEIGGLPVIMGWDSLDEYLLGYKGWEYSQMPDIHVKHYRETNQASNWKKVAKKHAYLYHNFRYGAIITAISCAKRGLQHRPSIINGLYTFLYWMGLVFQPTTDRVDPAVGKYIRRYRFAQLWKRLG